MQSECSEHVLSNSPLEIPAFSRPKGVSLESQLAEFRRDVLQGLGLRSKQLPCKYFYDQRGSQLFDDICQLDAYYPTRTETQIMQAHGREIASHVGPRAVVVEYGSGSSTKTRILLDHLPNARAYMPVDISEEHLLRTSAQLQADYPELHVHPIVADFTAYFDIPQPLAGKAPTIYFPGSTIGNLERRAAMELLKQIRRQAGPRGGLLIGIDLEKDIAVLQRAYDDEEGVTAEFNLNLLHRINHELNGNFVVSRFAHRAIVNRQQSRVEIYIESLCAQTVQVAQRKFTFQPGERILTEYSHKYSVDDFTAMAARAGFLCDAVWQDQAQYFAVMLLRSQE
jgi:dimethylhistidine N-methyltransferase